MLQVMHKIKDFKMHITVYIGVTCLIMTMTIRADAHFMTEEHHQQSIVDNSSTSCEQFSKYARFNPYSVIGDTWMVFYYWASIMERLVFMFVVPFKQEMKFIRKHLDGNVTIPVNWTARSVLMTDQYNVSVLLVEQNDRGHYLVYLLREIKGPKDRIEPYDVRFKQTGDNKYVGLLHCKSDTMYVMSRLKDIPKQHVLYEEAAKLGYRRRGGKSYLDQGKNWKPIGEKVKGEYFLDPKFKKNFFKNVQTN